MFRNCSHTASRTSRWSGQSDARGRRFQVFLFRHSCLHSQWYLQDKIPDTAPSKTHTFHLDTQEECWVKPNEERCYVPNFFYFEEICDLFPTWSPKKHIKWNGRFLFSECSYMFSCLTESSQRTCPVKCLKDFPNMAPARSNTASDNRLSDNEKYRAYTCEQDGKH